MLKCDDCGAVFENPALLQDDRGEYWGAACFDYIPCCPECESQNYGEYNEYEDDENMEEDEDGED